MGQYTKPKISQPPKMKRYYHYQIHKKPFPKNKPYPIKPKSVISALIRPLIENNISYKTIHKPSIIITTNKKWNFTLISLLIP